MIRKRIGCGLLAVILSLAFSMPVNSYASGNFSDTTGHWAEGFISRAFSQGFVSGYPDGLFHPDKAVTRAEFVSMVNEAFDIHAPNKKNFSDVSYSHWFYTDVSTAVSATYAGGYNDNTFRPNSPITREEAAVMLSRILPYSKGSGNLQTYKDSRKVNSWARTALEKMCGKQYFGAYDDGKLHPSDPLTRAQTAKILCDMLNNETIVTKDTIVDKDGTKLSEKIYTGDIVIDEDLGSGSVTIDNCVILGNLTIHGGGSQSVTINNCRIAGINVSKSGNAVRVLIKGETTIPEFTASQTSILQSSVKGDFGIQKVIVKKAADLTLKGNFPNVNIEGAAATVSLESGKITNLTVTKEGKYSDITLTGKAQVDEATVNAESYFHGTGTITHMTVNADGVTYETKPKKMSVGISFDRAVAEGDIDVSVDFSPSNKATGVYLDTKITVTFNTSIKKKDGSPIADSDVTSFLTLHKGTKSGEKVECTATINSAKKVITLTPKSNLTTDTRYYAVLTKETIQNSGGNRNDEEYAYFTTGTKTSGSTWVTFNPGNGSAGISLSSVITIKFSEDVVKYSDGKDVTDSYLSEGILFKKDSVNGESVAYTATISSSDKITITPTANLTAGQKYYVAIVADKFKTKSDTKISGDSVTWTTASTTTPTTTSPAISNFQLTPGQNTIQVGFTPNTSGTIYALPWTGGTAPTDTQILAGTSATATANTTGTLTLTGLTPDTTYTVYAILRSSANVTSPRASRSTKTTAAPGLTGLSVVPHGGTTNVLTGFSSSTTTYTVEVPFGTTAVDVSAAAASGAEVRINGGTANPTQNIPVASGTTTDIVVNSTYNSTTTNYTIHVQVAGNTALESLTANGSAFMIQDGVEAYSTTISSSITSVSVSVDTMDDNASIHLGSKTGTGSCTETITLPSGIQTISFTVTSNNKTTTYSIQFFRTVP